MLADVIVGGMLVMTCIWSKCMCLWYFSAIDACIAELYESKVIYRMAEILEERYFGKFLKICHLVEFTLAVEPVLAIMIFITKWLIKRTGLSGP